MPGNSWTSGRGHFDTVASSYDALRPEIPGEVFVEVQTVAGLTKESSVIEVGAGTGQATIPLARLRASVVALEPGAALARLAAERLAVFPKVEVIQASFEAWEPGERRFDALLAANSWHWVDPSCAGGRLTMCLSRADGW